MPRLSPTEQIARAEQKKAKAEETIKRATNALRDADRRADTRRKIILGAALLKAAEAKPGISGFVRTTVKGLKRDADKAAFEGFELPAPPPVADDEPGPG